MRAVVVLVILASCGRYGFETSDVATDADDGSSRDDAVVDTGPPAWARLAPLGYYPFDGTGEDLAFAGGTVACTGCTFQPGHRGSAVLAPPQSLPDHPNSGSDFTAALWIYMPPVFPGLFAGCPTYLSAQMNIEADDGPPHILLYGTSSILSPEVSTFVSGDAWIHVAMTYVASTGLTTLFVNGVQIRSGTADVANSLNPGGIGGESCAVLLDELLLFDRVLTPSEIAEVRDL